MEPRPVFAAIEQYIIPVLEEIYRTVGYLGIFFAMAIESACIPLPSEIVLPLAGWMVARGEFDFWLAALAGSNLRDIVSRTTGDLARGYTTVYMAEMALIVVALGLLIALPREAFVTRAKGQSAFAGLTDLPGT